MFNQKTFFIIVVAGIAIATVMTVIAIYGMVLMHAPHHAPTPAPTLVPAYTAPVTPAAPAQ